MRPTRPCADPALCPRCARAARAGRRIGAWLLIGAVTASATPSLAQEALRAIDTPGLAQLQVCRSWMVMRSCNDYSRVEVPRRISVGDQLWLEFGSNNKSMTFGVEAIHRHGDACTLYSEVPGPDTDETTVDKLTVAPCGKPG
jgi:hypothetical protein